MLPNQRNQLNIFQITNIFNVAFRREFDRLKQATTKKLSLLDTVGCQHVRMFFDGAYDNLQFANYFLENELLEDHLNELQSVFLRRFFTDFTNQDAEKIKQTAANIINAIEKLMLDRTVVQFEDLLYIDFKHLLESPDNEIKHYTYLQDELHEYLRANGRRTRDYPGALERCGNKHMRTSQMNEDEYEDYLKHEFDHNYVKIKPKM